MSVYELLVVHNLEEIIIDYHGQTLYSQIFSILSLLRYTCINRFIHAIEYPFMNRVPTQVLKCSLSIIILSHFIFLVPKLDLLLVKL